MPEFNDTLATGFPQLDEDHRELFRQLDALAVAFAAGGGSDESAALVGVLQTYALQHFAREEQLMREVACPTLTQNCAAHEEFRRKLDGWLTLLCMGGGTKSLPADIHREATAWLVRHISHVDCGLRHCRSRAPGSG